MHAEHRICVSVLLGHAYMRPACRFASTWPKNGCSVLWTDLPNQCWYVAATDEAWRTLQPLLGDHPFYRGENTVLIWWSLWMLVRHFFVLRCVAAPRGSSCAIALGWSIAHHVHSPRSKTRVRSGRGFDVCTTHSSQRSRWSIARL